MYNNPNNNYIVSGRSFFVCWVCLHCKKAHGAVMCTENFLEYKFILCIDSSEPRCSNAG